MMRIFLRHPFNILNSDVMKKFIPFLLLVTLCGCMIHKKYSVYNESNISNNIENNLN